MCHYVLSSEKLAIINSLNDQRDPRHVTQSRQNLLMHKILIAKVAEDRRDEMVGLGGHVVFTHVSQWLSLVRRHGGSWLENHSLAKLTSFVPISPPTLLSPDWLRLD